MTEQVLFSLPLDRMEPIFKGWVRDVLRSHNYSSEKKQNEDVFWGIKEAAVFLGLAVPTVYNLVHRREVPFMKRRQKLYFSRAQLTQWLKESRKKTLHEIENDAANSIPKEGVVL